MIHQLWFCDRKSTINGMFGHFFKVRWLFINRIQNIYLLKTLTQQKSNFHCPLSNGTNRNKGPNSLLPNYAYRYYNIYELMIQYFIWKIKIIFVLPDNFIKLKKVIFWLFKKQWTCSFYLSDKVSCDFIDVWVVSSSPWVSICGSVSASGSTSSVFNKPISHLEHKEN